VVSIASGVTITYDQLSDVKFDTVAIQAGGTLQFRTDISTRLRVTNLLVMPGATLTIGTAANPVSVGVTAQVIISDTPIDLTKDPSQYGHGLIALGTVTMHGTTHPSTFTNLAVEAHAGDTTLKLSSPAVGWSVGDKLVIADSRQLYYGQRPEDGGTYTNETELPVIAAISADGLTITLSAPLAYDHLGSRDPDGNLTFLPYVGVLTRNVQVKSENALGVRGYVMFTMRANVDIEDVQFSGLGRTKEVAFDNTAYDATGAVAHAGTNEAGRYGVTFSHLYGPTTPPADGYQYTFVGNSVFCPMNAFVYRWGIGVVDSSYGLIDHNVLYNWAGAGIALQTGSEVQNVISNNFISHIWGSRGAPDDRGSVDVGHEGAGIWSASFDDTFNGNVVADAAIGYDLTGRGGGLIAIAASPGADTSVAANTKTENRHSTPLRSFVGNEVYGGLTEIGMYIWALGMGEDRWNLDPNMPESVIKNMKLWNVSDKGFYGYESNHLTFDGLVARDDSTLIARQLSAPTMFYAGDYIQEHFKVTNSNIQGFGVAWNPSSIGVDQQMVNTYLRNYADVEVTPPWWLLSADGLTVTRNITLQNDQFVALNVPESLGWLGHMGFVVMNTAPGSANQNLMANTVVKVLQFQGDPTANFRVYYNESQASAIVPQSQKDVTGALSLNASPVAGLTGAQVWAQYGIAIGGALAPSTATTKANFWGLLDPITG
jgi:hypothetical protein